LHHGPHGKHFVTVFEILGCNLLEVIKRYNYKGAPLPIARIMAK
jgi:serine/threonine-protein kinase SRPK3